MNRFLDRDIASQVELLIEELENELSQLNRSRQQKQLQLRRYKKALRAISLRGDNLPRPSSVISIDSVAKLRKDR